MPSDSHIPLALLSSVMCEQIWRWFQGRFSPGSEMQALLCEQKKLDDNIHLHNDNWYLHFQTIGVEVCFNKLMTNSLKCILSHWEEEWKPTKELHVKKLNSFQGSAMPVVIDSVSLNSLKWKHFFHSSPFAQNKWAKTPNKSVFKCPFPKTLPLRLPGDWRLNKRRSRFINSNSLCYERVSSADAALNEPEFWTAAPHWSLSEKGWRCW